MTIRTSELKIPSHHGSGEPDAGLGKIGDYYLDTESGKYYKRTISLSTVVQDGFNSLNTSTWGTYLNGDGSVVVENGVLKLTHGSTFATSGATIYTKNSFAKAGNLTFTCKWKPYTNHYNTATCPSIAFTSHTAGWGVNYAWRNAPRILLMLGATTDTSNRTSFTLYESGSTILDTASIDIDETVWHDLKIVLNCDTRIIKIYLNNTEIINEYCPNDTNWTNMTSELDLNINSANFGNASAEQFDDVLLTYGNPWGNEIYTYNDTTASITSLIDLQDTPSSYVAGKVLRSTSSGSEWAEIFTDTPMYAGHGVPTSAVNYEDKYLNIDDGFVYNYDYDDNSGWNPADAQSGVSIIDKYGFRPDPGTTGWGTTGVRSLQHQSSGKYYWEVYVILRSLAYEMVDIGMSLGTSGLNFPGWDASGSYGYYCTGQLVQNQAGIAYGDAYFGGDTIGIAVDLDANKIWFSLNNVWQNGGDPVAGTGEAFTMVAGDYYAHTAGGVTDDQTTAHFVSAHLTYSPPAGFAAGLGDSLEWDYVGDVSGGGGADTTNINLIELADTPSTYEVGKILRSTSNGTVWAGVDGEFVATNIYGNELIAEYNLSNETLDDTISDWEGDTDYSLYIEFDYTSNSSASPYSVLTAQFNGDTTTSNYSYAYEGIPSGIAYTNPSTMPTPGMVLAYNGITSGDTSTGYCKLRLKSGRIRTCIGLNNCSLSGQHQSNQYNSKWHNTADEVTSIKLLSGVAITGSIKIFKRAKIQNPAIDATNINIIELADTPSTYDDGKVLTSTTSGTEWATPSGGSGSGDLLQIPDIVANGEYKGITIERTVGEEVSLGDVVTYEFSSSKYVHADASDSTSVPVRALVTIDSTADSQIELLTYGVITNSSWSWSAGDIYLDTTSGTMTQTAPTGTGEFVQILGYALTATSIFFDPDKTVIELS